MSITDALRIAFSAGSGRRLPEGQSDNAEQVTWAHAVTGLAILALVQIGLIFVSSGGLEGGVIRDLSIVAFLALAAPFIVLAVAARLVGAGARLPAAFLYLSLVLAALQLVSAVMSSFGSASAGFLIGLLAAVNFLVARNFLRLPWPGAVAVMLLVVAAFIGAGMLQFVLPSARSLA